MKFKKGFTLIELMVVVAIIGLLASIVVVSLQGARSGARDAKRQADLKGLQIAMELCYSDSTCGAAEQYLVYANYTAAKAGGIGTYIIVESMPDDPSTGVSYNWVSTTSTYCVYADLEDVDYYFISEGGAGERSSAGCP